MLIHLTIIFHYNKSSLKLYVKINPQQETQIIFFFSKHFNKIIISTLLTLY